MSCKGCGAPIEYPKCSYCGRIPPSQTPSAEDIARAIWDAPVKNYNSGAIFTSTGMVPNATTLLEAMGLDLEKEKRKKSYTDYWKQVSERRRRW